MKPSKQCTAATNKANRILGLINRTFSFKNEANVIKLYKSLVRPHLEYAVQAWTPYLQKDIKRLEGVQRRATKLVPSLRTKQYETRLREVELFPLSYRRSRGDLIQVYKIFNKIDDVDLDPIIQLNQNGLRNNGLKIKNAAFKTSLRQHSFSRRIPEKWNQLPPHVVGAPSLTSFKSRLDKLRFNEPGATWPSP